MRQGKGNKKQRDENLVRFVYLKKVLRHFVPAAREMWEKQVERLQAIDALKRSILAHSAMYENDEFRVFPKSQSALWEEGCDREGGIYIGAKWGKYIRAPKIFFTVVEKGQDLLVPLKTIAEVRFGIKTGANEFFYLTEEEIRRRGIEKEFWMRQNPDGTWTPNYVIKSPRECKAVALDPDALKYRVLMIHTDKKDLRRKNVLKYIRAGERKNFHKRPTCKSRGSRWYDLGKREPSGFLHPMVHNDRQLIALNPSSCYVDHNLFEITPKDATLLQPIAAFFISTISILFKELGGRVNLGEGALKTEGTDISKLSCLDFQRIPKRTIELLSRWMDENGDYEHESLFHEIGAKDPTKVSLGVIKPSRRELDEIVMGKILGMTHEEQLEVYKAVVDLVSARLKKAKSLGNRKRTKEGIDVEALSNVVMDNIGGTSFGEFYSREILSLKELTDWDLPNEKDNVAISKELFGWRLHYGKKFYLQCDSEEEARYLKVFTEAGYDSVQMPARVKDLHKLLPGLEALKKNIDQVIDSYLESIVSSKTQILIRNILWSKIRGYNDLYDE